MNPAFLKGILVRQEGEEKGLECVSGEKHHPRRSDDQNYKPKLVMPISTARANKGE